MYRVILLSFGLALLVVSGQSEKMCSCGVLTKERNTCCKQDLNFTTQLSEEVKGCLSIPRRFPSCDFDICIAQKLGYASSDGTVDKRAYMEKIEKDFENNSDLTDKIKDVCINGDISKYGKEDLCDVMKLKMCTNIQIMKSCEEWKDDGYCKGTKDLAEECFKKFD